MLNARFLPTMHLRTGINLAPQLFRIVAGAILTLSAKDVPKRRLRVFAIILLFGPLSTVAVSLTDGLIGYYSLNGSAFDGSGNGNHGLISGAVTTTDAWGRTSSALYFDGVNDSVSIDIAQLPLGSAARTVSIWARSEADSSQGATLAGYGVSVNGGAFTIMNNGAPYRWAAEVHGGGLGAYGPVVVDQNWHLLVATYDGSRLALYFDGQLAAENLVALNTGSSTFRLGESYENMGSFKGAIDDLRIYDRALSPEEVTLLYGTVPSAVPDVAGSAPLLLLSIVGMTYLRRRF